MASYCFRPSCLRLRANTRAFSHCHRDLVLWNQRNNNDQNNRGQNMRPMVESLLGNAMSRATSTLQTNNQNSNINVKRGTANTVNAGAGGEGNERTRVMLMDAAIVRTTNQIANKEEEEADAGSSSANRYNVAEDTLPHEDKRTYLSNPAVTPTAMAHSLWSQVVRPYDDTVIDATAGNGKDSLVLANLLFPRQEYKHLSTTYHADDLNSIKSSPKLISIDIQKRACENTFQLLKENTMEEIMENYIQVLHTSHAPMPSLPFESVGLICYNLGYLPGTADKEQFNTQMLTTIQSLADSALLIRPGGLLSVMSYPGNGWKEHCAVSYFMEGLAMFTTRDKKGGGWRVYLESIPSDRVLEQHHFDLYCNNDMDELEEECENVDQLTDEDDGTASIRYTVQLALERVHSMGFQKQTWRVFEHKPLGRPLSPILFTGMRIK
eukprot:CAMPEP_0176488280 /NCGR_PEP_ID=MMETSP0200_2-20121128/6619_1 /TAXON_ID=947934 /ORGANISM="Chaetoceros sp., Strain GSL56" /LENGTH=436 /DNA_ID=CAMNT_0017885241 /DNA_START=177 /DNA_END=1487 /DNA_ORIENTATION=-